MKNKQSWFTLSILFMGMASYNIPILYIPLELDYIKGACNR